MAGNTYEDILGTLQQEERYRKLPRHRAAEAYIDLCSNDYMGMAQRASEWREEFASLYGHPAMTSSASRLLASDQYEYQRLENWLSEKYGKAAIFFNSGYHANVGVVSALSIPGTLWLSDKLIHASAIDGLRLGRADFKRWNHNDSEHLRRIIEKEYDRYERLIVLCESIYSMDGDMAPIEELVELKKCYPKIMLYVDEAHGLGVFGRKGLGLCEQLGAIDDIDIIVGTLGKACASQGAFVMAEERIRDYLVNSSRSLIFSTALPPISAAWSHFMLEKLSKMESRRNHLMHISCIFREGIEAITGEACASRSPIVPLLTGNASRAVTISQALEASGILALPIRRPTVPPGGERIRFSLNANLCEDDIHHILRIIRRVYEN